MTFEEVKSQLPKDMKCIDVSGENWRSYLFPNDETVTITSPILLYVAEGRGHYVVDSSGFTHYIPYKWIDLMWFNRNGQPLSCFMKSER